MNASAVPPPPCVTVIGQSPLLFWGLSPTERVRRMVGEQGLIWGGDDPANADLISNGAFVYDPLWFGHVRHHPGVVLTHQGRPVLAHIQNAVQRAQVVTAMRADAPLPPECGLVRVSVEDAATLYNATTRNRITPFVDRLNAANRPGLERASYFGAYKGVTDLLTKYLWPEWALVLTRIAARIGMSPNQITAIGFLCCLITTWLFWTGHYWPGMATALAFMVLDTVDGKLARCTITSSWWGNVFDHGIDLVHPPFWWWAWCVGLSAWGLALSPTAFTMVMGVTVIGYGVQRAVEATFMARNRGIHIHMWKRLDSRFRLITARRNPNMVILLASLVASRPDLGIVAVAGWTAISCLFHLVRLAQAEWARLHGQTIGSWMEDSV